MQWAIFNRISPIGDDRTADLGPALIRKTLVDIHTPKGGKEYSVEDFMPFAYRRPDISDLDRALIEWGKSLGAMANG
jgi:hypothetical protein